MVEPLSIKTLLDATTDAKDLERYVNDKIPAIITPRIGDAKPNYAKLAADFVSLRDESLESFEQEGAEAIDRVTTFVWRGIWMADTEYAAKDTVTAFAARNPGDAPAMLQFFTMQPHRSSGDFNTDREAGLWNVDVGGVPRAELASPSGSSLVGFLALTAKAKLRSLDSKLREIGNTPRDIDTNITDQVMADWAEYGGDTLPSGEYVMARGLVAPGSRRLKLLGDAFLDFSEADDPNLFPGGGCFYAYAGDLVPLAGLVVSPTRGGNVLTFSEVPDIIRGDRPLIYNPSEFSWSDHRANYKAGEFCSAEAISGKLVRLFGSFYAGYDLDQIQMLRLPRANFGISGGRLRVRGSRKPSMAGIAATKLVHYNGYDLNNLSSTDSIYASVALNKCVGGTGQGMRAGQANDVAAGLDYGLALINCQDADFVGVFEGGRHGVTTGGGPEVGCVPCRNIRVGGTIRNSASAGQGIGAANTHGNSEFITYYGMLDGGYSGGGNNIKVLPGSTLIGKVSQNGIAILLAEMVGANFKFAGTHVRSNGELPSGRAVIDVGGNSIAMDARTKFGGTLDFSYMTVDAPDANGGFRHVNRGYVGEEPYNLLLTGTHFQKLASTALFAISIPAPALGGKAMGVCDVRGLVLPAVTYTNSPFSVNAMAIEKIRGWSRTGTLSLVASTSVNTISIAVVYPMEAPFRPTVLPAIDRYQLGSQAYNVSISGSTKTGFTLNIATVGGANFASPVVFSATYDASLEQ